MSSAQSDTSGSVDLAEYCRRVEEHLGRVNQGHLIRVAGTSFELVRQWALEGIPIGIVYRGIEQKAERHRAGASKRPLRLEFCEGDVRALYDDWRRAIGVPGSPAVEGDDESPAIEERRRPSVVRQIDRAVNRLIAAAGRLETPDLLREALVEILDRLTALREELRGARGEARRALVERVMAIDGEIGAAARRAADVGIAEVEAEAAREMAAFRARLSEDAWQRSLNAAVDRLLRDRYGLPTLDVTMPPS